MFVIMFIMFIVCSLFDDHEIFVPRDSFHLLHSSNRSASQPHPNRTGRAAGAVAHETGALRAENGAASVDGRRGRRGTRLDWFRFPTQPLINSIASIPNSYCFLRMFHYKSRCQDPPNVVALQVRGLPEDLVATTRSRTSQEDPLHSDNAVDSSEYIHASNDLQLRSFAKQAKLGVQGWSPLSNSQQFLVSISASELQASPSRVTA